MSIIHILDEPTINQIAAGEVVERPSAVVKELIENAMDAGATAITAELKDGGLSFIRITDNGAGIPKEDIPLAFLRHATSKIKSAEDLLSITSLGFRGEALSSISAVAQVELITKTPSSLNGYRYIIEGGEEKSLEEIGCPGGTTIIVRNLFYNTPARRKFLKSATTEAGYVSDLMERLMISHPNISFKFILNNQVKLQSSGNNNSKDILYHIYGRDISKELVSLEYKSEDISISGYIGKPVINRGNRNFENYFINGRYIKSNVITKAIEEAYKPFLMQHKYPFTSIYFEINPSLIDVNVHPQKLEIRLKNSEEVYQTAFHVIRDALSNKEMIPKVKLTTEEEKKVVLVKLPEPFEENRRKQITSTLYEENMVNATPHSLGLKNTPPSQDYVAEKSPYAAVETLNSSILAKAETSNEKAFDLHKEDAVNHNTSIDASQNTEQLKADKPDTESKRIPEVTSTTQMNLFEETDTETSVPFLSKQALQEHRIIGQVFQTYWLVEYQKELYIIDQHAAHEKVLYERIMTAARNKTYASQQLLPPIVLTLSLREQEVIKKHEDILASLGYEIEQFGGNEYSVRAVPADLYGISEKELLLEFIDELAEEYIGKITDPNSVLERVASLSCKAAVKANHSFTSEEAAALINELLTLENPYHCPHGRPVIVSMSQYEMERKFKRIV